MKYEIYTKAIDLLRFYCINDIANMLANTYDEYCKLNNFLENYCDEI